MTDNTEIFRHLRPKYFDPRKFELVPFSDGGISFLLKPTGDKQYDFWIYICPQGTSFSIRQAVKRLRDSANGNIVPWGKIALTGEPIIDLLVKNVMEENQALPSEVAKQVLDVVIINSYSEYQISEIKEKIENGSAKQQYEEH